HALCHLILRLYECYRTSVLPGNHVGKFARIYYRAGPPTHARLGRADAAFARPQAPPVFAPSSLQKVGKLSLRFIWPGLDFQGRRDDASGQPTGHQSENSPVLAHYSPINPLSSWHFGCFTAPARDCTISC